MDRAAPVAERLGQYLGDQYRQIGGHADRSYTPNDRVSLTYNNYVGNQPGGLLRVYNELIGRVSLSPTFQLALTFDAGTQVQADGAGTAFWYGAALLARWQLCPRIALGGRLERYSDPNDVIVPDPTPNGFQVDGASVNVDIELHKHLVWRNEARILLSQQDAVLRRWMAPITSDKFLVSSRAFRSDSYGEADGGNLTLGHSPLVGL